MKFIILIIFSKIFSIDYGIDVLVDNGFNDLIGKRVGILANIASIDRNNINTIDILIENDKIDLIKIFAPEHGVQLKYSAGEKFNNSNYNDYNVISLYGSNRTPSIEDVNNLDVIIIDLQDIGSTYYTYLSTVTYMLEIAAMQKIPVLVLDRPNPLGRKVYGPKKQIFNFIGLHPIPIRHGMTLGELCLMINDEGWLKNKLENLKIIKMQNFRKISDFNNWVPPSPNIPDLKTAIIYNGTCLFEGTNLSEGRGTEAPFHYIGAPWVNSDELLNYIQSLNFKKFNSSINVKKIEFIPKSKDGAISPKYENEICYGVSLNIDSSIEPLEFTLYLLEFFFNNYENFKFQDNFFDILYGSSNFRKCLLNKCNINEIFNDIDKDTKDFIKLREKYLLY
tara:strand:+ start:1888 stop:3066 length:1179 start_codon:yes stop_codon:yes gene_type:complete